MPTFLGISRRHWIGAAIALWLAFVVWLLASDSDEEKIRARLDDLALAVSSRNDENLAFRRLRLKSDFEEMLTTDVRLSVPELPLTTGRQELARLAGTAPRFFGELDISIGSTEISIDEATDVATAVSEVTVSGNSGEFRRDTRKVTFTLKEDGGDWLVSRIDVEPKRVD